MRCDDGHYYVVKFRNNPQHERVLANELLTTKIAEIVGLPVPAGEIVEVPTLLAEQTPGLTMVLGERRIPCEAGLQFGSKLAVSPFEGQVFDYLPHEMLKNVRNLETFLGILVLDKWTCNADTRQVVFWRRIRERKYSASFIDHGYCFNAEEWTLSDAPLQGVYPRNEVYRSVSGWMSFEPWLSRIESLDDQAIWNAAGSIPPQWYGSAWNELERLVLGLIARKRLVRQSILSFRKSLRQPFPAWQDG